MLSDKYICKITEKYCRPGFWILNATSGLLSLQLQSEVQNKIYFKLELTSDKHYQILINDLYYKHIHFLL